MINGKENMISIINNYNKGLLNGDTKQVTEIFTNLGEGNSDTRILERRIK